MLHIYMKRIEELTYNAVMNTISRIENTQQKETVVKVVYDFYEFGIFKAKTKSELLSYINKRF